VINDGERKLKEKRDKNERKRRKRKEKGFRTAVLVYNTDVFVDCFPFFPPLGEEDEGRRL
jgi:hypothetical protein